MLERLDFARARVVSVEDVLILLVAGTAPCLNMTVMLSPLQYAEPPEYWAINVLGTVQGRPKHPPYDYSKHLKLTGLTGSKGVEIFGKTTNKKIDLSGI